MERSNMLKDIALDLARRGFKLFPCHSNDKVPAVKRWNDVATTDETKVKSWFINDYNIGIHADEYQGKNLVIIDVDTKNNVDGFDTLNKLGIDMPETFTVSTPSGGKHFYFLSDEIFSNGTKVLGKGIDVRAKGGYVVAPGSSIDGKEYAIENDSPITELPDNIKNLLKRKTENVIAYEPQDGEINIDYAKQRFKDYLEQNKHLVNEGERNTEAFKRACKAKDFGLDAQTTLDLMENLFLTHPPMDTEELIHAVRSAFKYGKNPLGIDAPEKIFSSLPFITGASYLDEMNKRYAILFDGGNTWYIEEFYKNGVRTGYMMHGAAAFKVLLANKFVYADGGKKMSVHNKWIEWPNRREYHKIAWDPSNSTPKDVFNTWTGFSQTLKDPKDFDEYENYAIELFTTHLKENLSNGDSSFYIWLTGFLANIIQHPTKKYPNAVILKGDKGTGKSLLIDIMREVIGEKYVVSISDLNSAVGNFNSVVNEKLLINIDEAYWAGNKSVDAPIKHLISTEHLTIKEKFKPERIIPWYGRIISTTNNEHAALVTQEERRYAIKTVNSDAKHLKALLEKVAKVCKSPKGACAIFNYLRSWDLSQVNLRHACVTKELVEQKTLNLEPVHQAWYTLLVEEKLGNINWVEGESISFHQMYLEIINHVRCHFPRSYKYPLSHFVSKAIHAVCPSLKSKRITNDSGRDTVKIFPSLQEARKEFANFLNMDAIEWGEDEDMWEYL